MLVAQVFETHDAEETAHSSLLNPGSVSRAPDSAGSHGLPSMTVCSWLPDSALLLSMIPFIRRQLGFCGGLS